MRRALPRTWVRSLASWVLGVSALGLPVGAGAEDASPAPEVGEADEDGAPREMPEDVEVMVILGTRQKDLILQEAVSVTAFDAVALEALGVQDVSDLAAVTPSMEINTISATTPTFFIRGVGLNDFASNATGAVAIYQDGVPINAPALQLGQMFDVESVEVLRGPQAFGNQRNASAGVISMKSKPPTGEIEATLRADYGRFDFRDLEGALALPLTGDGALSTRLAFRYSGRDPFFENRCGGLPVPTQGACGSSAVRATDPVPAGLPDPVGSQGRWAVRGLVRLEPTTNDSDWLLNLHGAGVDQDSALGQVFGTAPNVRTGSGYTDPAVQAIFDSIVEELVAGGLSRPKARRAATPETLARVTNDIALADPFANDYSLVGREKLDSYGGSLRGVFNLGDVEVETITGAETYDRSRGTDFDFSPDTAFHSHTDDNAWQVTQSVHFESELDTLPLTWRGGGFFLTEDLESVSLFDFTFGRGAKTNSVEQGFTQQNYSFGVYGSFKWDFNDAFTLEGGARFNYDRKDFELGIVRPDLAAAPQPPGSESASWTAPTGSLSLTYRPTDTAEIYVKYTRGWKPGVFNSAILRNTSQGGELIPNIKITDPEKIDSFELGTKLRLFDDTVKLGANLFYYKYLDYQVFILRSNLNQLAQFEIVNADNAEIYGLELDLHAEPLLGRVPGLWENLVAEARFGWLESRFLRFADTETILIANATTVRVVDFSGNSLPNTPRFKVSGSLHLPIDLGRYGTLTPRWDFSFTDDVFFDPSEGVGRRAEAPLPEFAIAQKAYVLHHLRLTYLFPNEQIGIAAWVRNLTDERYKTYAAQATGFEALLNWVGDPRTYGLSVTIDW